MSTGALSSICFAICACLLIPSILGAPQRSIQLGGTGPRPVALGGPPPGATYSQQLAFGPPQQQLQFQPQPQQQQQLRVRQPTSPVLLQQGNLGSQAPIGSFPIPANPRQPIILRSPVSATPAAAEEDEYEDEEYEEPAAPKVVPIQQVVQQRAPVRLAQQQPQFQQSVLGQLGPGPQRFAVPQQQPQPQPQQPQPQPQPQQRRVVQRVPLAPSPVQQIQASPQPQPQPRPINQQQQRQQLLGQDSRLAANGKDRLSATPPPIQTVNRYNRQNEDGSITWGYENEDGTFKEETLGADCVVRGKYGYVDPDGMKREYEYQSGNPCDPNKRGQPEEDDTDELVLAGPQQQQRLAGLINARPVQAVQRRPQQQQQQFQPQ